MRNLFIGAVFGAILSISVQYVFMPDAKTEISNAQQLNTGDARITQTIASPENNDKPLSEQQVRKIIQDEIHSGVTQQLASFNKELRRLAESEANTGVTKIQESPDVEQAIEKPEDNPMYLTVSDIVDTARQDGYFTKESLADLKLHYAELSDSQKFQIDAKLADSINKGTLEFDESLFFTLP